MKVAAIDSAESSGLAVVAREAGQREQLLHHGVALVRTAADVEAAVAQLAAFEPTVWVVEEPFFSRHQPAAGMALAILLGRWRQALENRGHAVLTVPAALWQGGCLHGLIGPRAMRAERKAAAITWCSATFGVRVATDAADAICMGAYVLRNLTVKARAA